MDDIAISRRGFLQGGARVGAAGLVQSLLPVSAGLVASACSARDEDAAFRFLPADEARDFAAMAARIIPTTATPGATEAGVVHFFDQAFAADMKDAYGLARTELETLNATIADGRFADQDAHTQDALLAGLEGEPFFELVRVMTIFGFFAMREYGGNREHVGWDLIGFEGHRGAWQPPFGYYDAQVLDTDDATGES